ncbi:MAG: glycosyltransferase family protein [Ruminococcus flavefaciens]|nr:glycosyltransferase family protein [Ruminococcus flavefaciens]
MKYLAMIQARCGSTRLPNKVLKDLCGKPALQRMIERVQRSELVDEVMVVTSIEKNNLPILGLCADLGVRVGVGSEDDVLDRFYQTAKLLKPEYVIRLTADCPCFDAGLLDLAVREMRPAADYMGMMSESFADGLDLEIMKFSALEKAWREADQLFEREHVTQYMIRHPEIFILQDFESPTGFFGNYRWTVDEPEDFEVVRLIYEHFQSMEHCDDFTYKDILGYMEEHPGIKEINNMYTRNEGLAKSMNESHIVDIANIKMLENQ